MATELTGQDDIRRYDRFITTVQQACGVASEEASDAARAVLETLSERLEWGEASELASELPEPLRSWLLEARGDREPFHADEFLRRVADHEDADLDTAECHTRAVFIALASMLSPTAFRDLIARLPNDYRPLLRNAVRAPHDTGDGRVIGDDTFLKMVGERAGLDREGAERSTQAVLQTLAERLSAGQVEDIAGCLPPAFRPALDRGKDAGGGKAQAMSVDEFVARVAELEGVSPGDALEHARAVFAVLRHALPPKELSDIMHQLSREYYEVLL